MYYARLFLFFSKDMVLLEKVKAAPCLNTTRPNNIFWCATPQASSATFKAIRTLADEDKIYGELLKDVSKIFEPEEDNLKADAILVCAIDNWKSFCGCHNS